MSDRRYPLRFGPGTQTGFTPAGISGFADLRPAAVVRELIQNSLDAAAEGNRPTAVVRFRLSSLSLSSIPGLREYREAFRRAVRTQRKLGGGELPSQAARVVKIIQSALSKGRHDALCVMDNGVGLDAKRMSALLSDGISAKSQASTGTFGNGHSVIIPASDLRYILYGGITRNGGRIGSGHAVLASSIASNKDHPCSADGFLVSEFRNGTQKYYTGQNIPSVIASYLDDIERTHGCGSVVVVPCFNSFRQEDDLRETLFRAAACNFFQAIGDGRLVIHYEDQRDGGDTDSRVLNKDTLEAVLHENKDEMRSSSFLSGSRAFEAHQTIRFGTEHKVKTCLGVVRLIILQKTSGITRIELCRNGMWITDDRKISQLAYRFQDREPFHAILSLHNADGGRFHELVRNSEGPLHEKLDIKQRLSSDDASQLRRAFRELREWLLENIPVVREDAYSPEDFLTLDFGDNPGRGRHGPSFWGMPVAVSHREPSTSRVEIDPLPDPDPDPDRPPKPPPRPPRPRPALRPFLQAVAIPTGPNRRAVRVECFEACKNAELRIYIDENFDATCEPTRRNEIDTVILQEVQIDGEGVSADKLVQLDGHTVGVRLGDLQKGDSLEFQVQYQLPNMMLAVPGLDPSLRVEVFRRPPETKGGSSDG